MRIDRIEATVFDSLAQELKEPVQVRSFLWEYRAKLMRLTRDASRRCYRLERSAAKANAAFDRAYKLYSNGVTVGAMAQTATRQLQKEARSADAAPAQAGQQPEKVDLHPSSRERHIGAVPARSGRLGAHDHDAVATIRELVSAVIIAPTDSGLDVVVEGYPGAVLGENPKCRVLMVAEGRYERRPHHPEIRYSLRSCA